MPAPPTILVFDSGLGGLTVLREIVRARPDAHYVYVADDAFFPYGHHGEEAIIARVVPLVGELIARHAPALVVIACNTASTLVMSHLRSAYSVPFVGTVPAIKPAAERTKTGVVAVLATPGTMKRDYTRGLIQSFAQSCHVRLVGAPELARIAEARMRGEAIDRDAVSEQITPAFVELDGKRTDIVVLACTHYPFLADIFAELAPWPVTWLDPAPAIARRLATVIENAGVGHGGEGVAIFTSGRSAPQPIARLLSDHGLTTRAFVGCAGFDIGMSNP